MVTVVSDGNYAHVAHCAEIEVSFTKFSFATDGQTKQMPYTGQMTDFTLNVRTYI